MPDTENTCPHCARPVTSGATKGLCLACLTSSLSELLGETAGGEAAPTPSLATPHERVGDYELLDELGRGGMGVVFRARDHRLQRLVALKLILTGQLASEAEVKRFQNEAEAAAHLEHPNIVPIYEVGESGGRHFFAMKLVEGGTLADAGGKVGKWESETGAFASHSPTFPPAHFPLEKAEPIHPSYTGKEAAHLVAKIARAVHHAHQRGILHRDLKPGNILLDAAGEPLVADFGLARRVEGDSSLTLSGAVLGSPSYMAPEQASGGTRAVTTTADIYSLGAILYELLCGQPPFVAATSLETMRKVVEEEPVAPWVVRRRRANPKSEGRHPKEIRTPKSESPPAAARPRGSDFGLRPSDLDIICLKCLQKDPARRYATAEALAEDLERWLRHEPILARPSSVWERALKWARRHPARAGLLALALLAPAVIITVLLVMGAKLRHERNLALTQKSLALSEARRAETNALTARQNSYAADMFLAARALEIGNLGLARRTLLAHVPRAGEEDLRGFEWRHYWHRAQGQQERVLGGFSNAVNSVAFSPDGRWLAAGGGNLVHKWDTTNFALAATSQHDAKALVNSVAFSADGSTLWTGDQKGQVRVWLDGLARPLVEFSRGTGFVHLALPAGAAGPIAIGERDGTEGGAHGAVALYGVTDLLTRNERGNVLTNSGGLAAVSRNGQWLLIGGGESPVTLHNLKTGEARNLGGWTQLLMALALSPDGTRAAISASNGHGVGLYNFSSNGQPYWTTVTFSWRCRALAYSPNGQTLAAASYDHTIRLLSASQGNQVHRLDGHTDQALAVAFSPDGKTLASSGQDGTVRLWNLTTLERDKMTNLYAPFIVSRDGRTIYASDEDTWTAHVRRLDLADPARARESLLRLRAERFPDVQPSHAGLLRWKFEGGATPEQWAQLEQFIGRHTGRILWRSGPEGRPTGPDRPIDRVTYPSASAADGSVVALVDGKNLHLWHNFTSRPLPDLPSPPPGILRLALSDDGHRLALATTVGNIVSVWDTPAGTNVFRLPPRASVVNELLFSPDGRTLLVAGADVAVQLRDARTGELQTTLTGHEVGIVCAAFSPDGRTLATAGQGGLKLWHLPTRREVGTVNVGATWLQFSPDGALLVAADWRGDAYLLRAPHRHDAGPPP